MGNRYKSKTKSDLIKYNKYKNSKKNSLVDFHTHSCGSTDAMYDIPFILDRAKNNGVEYIAITDHNSMVETRKYLNKNQRPLNLAKHNFDGVNLVPGIEITCRLDDVKNYKGNSTKIHMLVYSPLFSKGTPLSRLIDIKHRNDISVDFGLLINIARKEGIFINENEVRDYIVNKRKEVEGFSSLGVKDVLEFFQIKGYDFAKNYHSAYDYIQDIPRAERLNVSAYDLMQVAHASGGICVLAHPSVNLERTKHKKLAIETLLDYGIDGFEMTCPSTDKSTNDLIKSSCERIRSRNKILFTGGSDMHLYSSHIDVGRIGRNYLYKSQQKDFVTAIDSLNEIRKQKDLTNRYYRLITHDEISQIIKKYEESEKKNNIFDQEPTLFMG